MSPRLPVPASPRLPFPFRPLPLMLWSMKRFLKEVLNTGMIVLGIMSAGLGLKGFLLSSHFIDGGVTGISMLLSSVLRFPLAILILIINLPFIGIGLRQIGWRFALRSALAITGLSLCLAFVHYPDVTSDKVLTALFGGFFIGAGIGLAIRGGAVLDGTEIAALLVSKSSSLLRVGDVILLLNIVIFSAAAFFLGIEIALYSVLTYIAASRTIDFILHGIEEYTAITIISENSEAIREAILRRMKRGVTVYKGLGGKTGIEQDILFCVVTRLEIGRVKNVVKEIDPHSFIVINRLSDADGGITKRKTLH